MLKRAENVSIHHSPNMLSGNGWLILVVGRKSYRVAKVHKRDVATGEQTQTQYPVRVAQVAECTYWRYQDKYYYDNDGLDGPAVHALLVTRQQRQTQHIERAQQTVALGAQPRLAAPRGSIPVDLKHFVWTRDGGRCRNCGSGSELQFDHVIPLALGGGTAPENLQILCGPCNRRKSAGITEHR